MSTQSGNTIKSVQIKPDSLFKLNQNHCSDSSGFTAQINPESATAYLMARPRREFFSVENSRKLQTLSDSLDKSVALNDIKDEFQLKKTTSNKRRHRNVMKKIRSLENNRRDKSKFGFKPLINDGDFDLNELEDDVECFEFEIKDVCGKNEKVNLKAFYVKQAFEKLYDIAQTDKRMMKLIETNNPQFLMMALMQAKVLQQFEDASAEELLLSYAHIESLEQLKKLIKEKNPDINYQSTQEHSEGWSALLMTVANGDIDKARYLLQKGAEPNVHNKLGAFPLAYASHYGNPDMCKLLLEYGANINETDMEGMTPLMKASYAGHINVLNLLLQNGANINLKNMNGEPALDIAVKNKYGDIAKVLRKAKKNELSKSKNN